MLYRQTRVGKDGADFELLKLRTMVVGAERMGAGLAVNRGDPRITRAGRLLRKLSLDELPQLWNVVRGDMSLIGPRPTLRYQVEQYDERQRHRLDVRPGITGWAQIHGRAALPWAERIELDVWYVEHRSPRVDLRILLRTPLALFGGTYKGETGGWRERAAGLALRPSRHARALSASSPLVTVWNAAQYPPGQGYDAERPHGVRGRPGPTGGQPAPTRAASTTRRRVFYALAGVARLGGDRRRPRRAAPRRAGAERCSSCSGRRCSSGRSRASSGPVAAGSHLGALGFAALRCRCVKTAAMFHPEALSLLPRRARALAAASADVRDRPAGLALGAALGPAQLVRAWALWTFGAVAIALLFRRAAARARGRRRGSRAVVVAAPWYVAPGDRATREPRLATSRRSRSRSGTGGRRRSTSIRACPTSSRTRTGRTS